MAGALLDTNFRLAQNAVASSYRISSTSLWPEITQALRMVTCFLKRMLSRSVPDMTQGCWGTYAREPWIFTRPLLPRSSPRMAASRDDFPAAPHVLWSRVADKVQPRP